MAWVLISEMAYHIPQKIKKINTFEAIAVGRISSEISQSDSVAISSNWYGSALNATGLSSSAIFNAKKTGENIEFSTKLQQYSSILAFAS